jgi:multidrug transporter EmrE-like cation transporter
MNLFSFSLILTGVLLNAAAQLLLKTGTNLLGDLHVGVSEWGSLAVKIATCPPILGGLACYAISVVVWIVALSRVPVSQAYPMLSIGYVVNALVAWWLLGESLNALKISGIGFIIIGVVMVARA